MCERCQGQHDKGHQIIQNYPPIIADMICDNHDILFRYLCKDCVQYACTKCKITSYIEHEVMELSYKEDYKTNDEATWKEIDELIRM